MTFHSHPLPGTPDANGPTIVESNDRFCTVGANLGDLVMVLPRAVWHDDHPRYELRFRHGTIQMAHKTLEALVRMGSEAMSEAEEAL